MVTALKWLALGHRRSSPKKPGGADIFGPPVEILQGGSGDEGRAAVRERALGWWRIRGIGRIRRGNAMAAGMRGCRVGFYPTKGAAEWANGWGDGGVKVGWNPTIRLLRLLVSYYQRENQLIYLHPYLSCLHACILR